MQRCYPEIEEPHTEALPEAAPATRSSVRRGAYRRSPALRGMFTSDITRFASDSPRALPAAPLTALLTLDGFFWNVNHELIVYH